ncbi:hypothetical protein IC617_08625 [Neiella sp. HB171785]|uniref:Actin-like protein N-terminal domain-containing protein n=1 Tax=Neiella litorisoli TaxID=2771431 RepID=A0A8J6ULT1_9GAMM|nr:hypothetical protein [Neiella litorisoli]MBD1389490.1 hypothetical protein [Neiella litorisoli]
MEQIARSIDIGFGTLSCVTDLQNGLPTVETMPAIVSRKHSNDSLAVANYTSANMVFNIDGQLVEVGKDIGLTSGTDVCRDLSSSYVESLQYKALFTAGLNLMNLPDNRVDILVGGLPVERMSEKKALEHYMQGQHKVGDRLITVERAIVIAQPLAGLLCYAQQDGGERMNHLMRNQCVLGVDPGFLTFDWCVLNRGKPVDSMSGSNEFGLSKVIDAVSSVIKQAFSVSSVPSIAIEDALRTGSLRMFGKQYPFPICSGEQHDVSFDATTAIQSVCDMAMTDLKSQIGNGSGVDLIAQMGGPASLYSPALQRAFPRHQLSMAKNSLQAVVIGMQIFANNELSKQLRAVAS